MAHHKVTNKKTKIGQTHINYDFGMYRVVIKNEVTGELNSVRPRKIYWGPAHERLMQYNENFLVVLKKMDRRSFPEKTYQVIEFRKVA